VCLTLNAACSSSNSRRLRRTARQLQPTTPQSQQQHPCSSGRERLHTRGCSCKHTWQHAAVRPARCTHQVAAATGSAGCGCARTAPHRSSRLLAAGLLQRRLAAAMAAAAAAAACARRPQRVAWQLPWRR
jgi:hypothetical protein